MSILLGSFEDVNIDDDEQFDPILLKSMPPLFKKYLKKESLGTATLLEKEEETLHSKLLKEREEEEKELLLGKFDEGDDVEEDEEDEDDEADFSNLIYKKTTRVDRINLDMKEIQKLYANNECDYSLYIFSQKNPFRIALYKLTKSNKFDLFITIILIVSTCHQIIDTFLTDDFQNYIFDIIDLVISFIYIIELMIKVIALGFVGDQGSYLTYNWNKLDFFVIIITVIDVFNKIAFLVNETMVEALSFFNYLKLLRNLRTLRLLAKSDNVKKIIGSLLDSASSILKVLGIVFVVFVMFSIMGITLFYKLYNTCSIPSYVDNVLVEYIPLTNFTDYLVKYNISNVDRSYFVSLI